MEFSKLLFLVLIFSITKSDCLLSTVNKLKKGLLNTLLNQTVNIKVPSTAVVDLCDIVKCHGNTTCINGVCIPTCDGIQCPTGETCILLNITCLHPPCYPVPVCQMDPSTSVVDLCDIVECHGNTTCINGVCIPTCDGIQCPTGETCTLLNITCLHPPCHPVPVCQMISSTPVPNNNVPDSCDNISCSGNLTCINGSCVPPTCESLECGIGETCELILVNCLQPGPCYPIPICVADQQTDPIINTDSCADVSCLENTICIDGNCVSTCESISCGVGETCVLEVVNCLVPPCYPIPICVSDQETDPITNTDSCGDVSCPENTICIDGNCVSTCESISCGVGETCELEVVNCLVPPCYPIPICVSDQETHLINNTDSCADVSCPGYTICIDGNCVPTCESISCGVGETCVLEVVNCLVPPCYPIPICVPNQEIDPIDNTDDCAIVRCPENTICMDGNCVSTCESISCGVGETCELEVVNCFAAPCYPVPTCKPIIETTETVDKCALVLCQAGTMCLDGNCLPITCENTSCKRGETCVMVPIACFTSPCPPSVPHCVPDHYYSNSDPICAHINWGGRCSDTFCNNGEECFIQEVQCFFPPCPSVPTCIATSDGSKQFLYPFYAQGINYRNVDHVPLMTTCNDITCFGNEVCQLETIPCLVQPCPIIASCKRIDPCANVFCKPGSICTNGQCVQQNCNEFTCGPYEDCYLIYDPYYGIRVPSCRPQINTQFLNWYYERKQRFY